MKNILKYFLLLSLVSFMACDKVDNLPYYDKGEPVSLTSSVNSVAAAPADSNNVALTFFWTSPDYASDSNTYKYIVEIDSTGRNFSKKATKTVTGELSASFTAKELNAILLNFGFAYRTEYEVDVRVISSYGNNNEQYQSNVLKLKVTPYVIPPKVVPPTGNRLFIVGSATQGNWDNPVPVPTQELTKIDSVTYGGIFELKAGGEFLILPLNGDWGHKFSLEDNGIPGIEVSGSFGYDYAKNFKGPVAAGWYKIILDFQAGKFTVSPFTQQHGLPQGLFIVGNATPGQWSNPVPVPSQEFTRINATQYQLASIALNGGSEYLLLPENGNWGKKYGVTDNTIAANKVSGVLVPEGQNLPGPETAGNYKITVDFVNNSYKLVKL